MDGVDTRYWTCTLSYPEGWIELPLDAEHVDLDKPQALVRLVADRLAQLPPNPPPLVDPGTDVRGQVGGSSSNPPPLSATGDASRGRVERDELAVELIAAVLAEDVERGAVLGAHRFQHDPRFGHVHAHLTVWVEVRRHPESLADELAGLLDLTRRVHNAVEEPEVDQMSLPAAGPALRVRFLEAERIGGAADGPRSANREDVHDVDNDDHDASDIYAVLVDTVTYLVPVQDTAYGLWLRFWTPHLATAEQLVAEFDDIAQALVVDPGVGDRGRGITPKATARANRRQ